MTLQAQTYIPDVRKVERASKARLGIWILLVCSLVLNVLLARVLFSLRNGIQTLRQQVTLIKSESQLGVGELVRSFVAKDLNGRPVLIDYRHDNLPTVLYIFSPGCGWCSRNLENIKTVATRARGECRVIGLSLSSEGLRDYVAQHDLTFPIYTDLPFDITRQYKMGGTPQTVVVSPESRVLKNWMGAYDGVLQKEVEEYFKLSLPGVANN